MTVPLKPPSTELWGNLVILGAVIRRSIHPTVLAAEIITQVLRTEGGSKRPWRRAVPIETPLKHSRTNNYAKGILTLRHCNRNLRSLSYLAWKTVKRLVESLHELAAALHTATARFRLYLY